MSRDVVPCPICRIPCLCVHWAACSGAEKRQRKWDKFWRQYLPLRLLESFHGIGTRRAPLPLLNQTWKRSANQRTARLMIDHRNNAPLADHRPPRPRAIRRRQHRRLQNLTARPSPTSRYGTSRFGGEFSYKPHELDQAEFPLDDVPRRLGDEGRPGAHPRRAPARGFFDDIAARRRAVVVRSRAPRLARAWKAAIESSRYACNGIPTTIARPTTPNARAVQLGPPRTRTASLRRGSPARHRGRHAVRDRTTRASSGRLRGPARAAGTGVSDARTARIDGADTKTAGQDPPYDVRFGVVRDDSASRSLVTGLREASNRNHRLQFRLRIGAGRDRDHRPVEPRCAQLPRQRRAVHAGQVEIRAGRGRIAPWPARTTPRARAACATPWPCACSRPTSTSATVGSSSTSGMSRIGIRGDRDQGQRHPRGNAARAPAALGSAVKRGRLRPARWRARCRHPWRRRVPWQINRRAEPLPP